MNVVPSAAPSVRHALFRRRRAVDVDVDELIVVAVADVRWRLGVALTNDNKWGLQTRSDAAVRTLISRQNRLREVRENQSERRRGSDEAAIGDYGTPSHRAKWVVMTFHLSSD